MVALLIVLAQTLPPQTQTPAQAVEDLQREMDRAQKVVAFVEADATGRMPSPTRIDEDLTARPQAPWALQAQFGRASWRGVEGHPVGSFPSVGVKTPMSFRLLPRMELTTSEVTVVVCRGAACNVVSWPWRCYSSGGCEVEGTGRALLGADAGEHVITFSIQATAGEARQTWEFTAAP